MDTSKLMKGISAGAAGFMVAKNDGKGFRTTSGADKESGEVTNRLHVKSDSTWITICANGRSEIKCQTLNYIA